VEEILPGFSSPERLLYNDISSFSEIIRDAFLILMIKGHRSKPQKNRKLPLKQSWIAPKQLKIMQEDILLSKRQWPKTYSSRKKSCRFYKTSHKFDEVSRKKFLFFHDLMIEYRCRCGKKKIEFTILK